MKLTEFSYRNILSYGNRLQTFKFGEEPRLILVEGENGSGKCLTGDTVVEIEISDLTIQNEFIEFIKKRSSLPSPLSPLDK